MVDGAAWLKQLQDRPQEAILLAHGEAMALARTLADAQAGVYAAFQRDLLGDAAGTARVSAPSAHPVSRG